MKKVSIFTDGSFSKKIGKGAWAFIVYDENSKIIHSNKGLVDDNSNSIWQVGAEIRAVIESIKYCKSNNFKADIYYDLKNLYLWVADLFNEKPWKCGNQWSKEYREFILKNKEHINSFQKVKSHTGVEGNERVDSLAYSVFKNAI